jgi:hypothetical protein
MVDTSPETVETSEAAVYCARHSNVETALACAKCGTPICPKCMVVTPVGMKCPDCGTNRGGQLFQIRAERLLLAGITALIAGAGAGLISSLGFFLIFLIAASYGYFAGNLILRASGMKRGLKLEMVAGTGMIIGGLAYKLLSLGGFLSIVALLSPWFWIVLIVSTACAVSKIRYL